MTESALTRRQQTIVAHLRARAQNGELPPTLDELCRALGLTSRGSMHKHIQALVEAGLVQPMDGRQRGVRLQPASPASTKALPLLGTIAAGQPLEAVEDTLTFEVPTALRTDNPCFVLQVRGDSMIEDGILDGDWVVVESRNHARNGEIVVALIDGNEATLKRIEQRPDQILLHPANAALRPLIYAPAQVQIQGVVVGQMRRYR